MSRRFWLGLGVVALIVLGVFYFLTQPTSPAEPQYEIVTVEQGTLVATVGASGQVLASEDRNLSFATSGQLAEVLVEEGEKVEAGQILARLDTEDLALQRVQAQATLSSARAALAQLREHPNADELAAAEAKLELAELNLIQAQQAWERIAWRSDASLFPEGPALQRAISEYKDALANYNLTVVGPSQNELTQAQAEVGRTQAALDQIQLQFERALLAAPFAGTVAEVLLEEGGTVSPGTPVLRLLDASALPIEVNIDEVDIGQVQTGQKATVIFEALPSLQLAGTVEFISPAATVEGGVVTYTVRIALERIDPGLRVGMTADVEIEVQRVTGLLIPNRAVQVDRETGKFYVERVTPTASELVEFIPGATNESYTQILTGLAEGDQIIIRPISGRELLQGAFSFGGGE